MQTAGLAGVALLAAAGCGVSGGKGPSGDTRRVGHALGRTRVPADPQRVVAPDSFIFLPVLLDAGVPVVDALSVGAVSGGGALPPYITEGEKRAVEIVGGAEDGPNLEAIWPGGCSPGPRRSWRRSTTARSSSPAVRRRGARSTRCPYHKTGNGTRFACPRKTDEKKASRLVGRSRGGEGS